jgi:putative chitinase
MAKINLRDFFRYYKDTPNQQEAIKILEEMSPITCMVDSSTWVLKFREPEPVPPAPDWPITKAQLATIMSCAASTLSNELMDDYAQCVADCTMDTLEQVYFLGQCGHESGGLKWPVELSDGQYLEGRTDIGNTQIGDGPLYRGHGWLQNTGRANTQAFSDYLDSVGRSDPKVMELGAEYIGPKYPWTVSGVWWRNNNMKAMCASRTACTNAEIDEVGARVNGRMRPNGADDRIAYTDRAYRTLIGV